MNEKNFDYLKDQLKYSGFGELINQELRNKMAEQPADFVVTYKAIVGRDHIMAELHFKRSEQTGMYFFNNYKLQLSDDKGNTLVKQTYYVSRSNTITLKEGYNLLQGRAVKKSLTNKQNEQYQAWVQLNFKEVAPNGNYELKTYHQNYGYELEKVLSNYPIKELASEETKERLIRSLEKGNLQTATLINNGKEEKVFLTPNVAFKSLHVLDSNMRRIDIQSLALNKAQEQSATLKQSETQHNIKQDKNSDQKQKQDDKKVDSKLSRSRKVGH